MWDKTNMILARSTDSPWYTDHSGWSWIMGLHGGVWLLIAILIIATLVLVLRPSTRTEQSSRTHRNSALDILKARYARGEIGRDEYVERRQHLS